MACTSVSDQGPDNSSVGRSCWPKHSALRLKGIFDVDSSPVSNQVGFLLLSSLQELARDGCELGVEDCPCLDWHVDKPMGFINQQEVENPLCFPT